MKKQKMNCEAMHNSPPVRIGKLVWTIILYLGLGLPAGMATTPSQAYKGALPIPGSSNTSETLYLNQNGTLFENDQITLDWQSDGNLVLYFYKKDVIWASNTEGKGNTLSFQSSDGKLVIKNGSGSVIWSSNGTGGNLLKLQSDRNLVILNSSNQQIWSTNSTIALLQSNILGTITANGQSKAQDFAIPANTSAKYIYLRVEGADGGYRKVTYLGVTTFTVGGGEGATIKATFPIGTGTNQIPPGSTLRFILGRKGAERAGLTTAGCTGGGGTGVLFKKPNDAHWTLLMVAGAGGGAYSDCCGQTKRAGHPGETGENGGKGGSDSGGAGGVNGSYGADGSVHDNTGTAGGGVYEGNGYANEWTSGAPGWEGARVKNSDGTYSWHTNILPQGGIGGKGAEDNISGLQRGAWGFGGGGGGDVSGGGGGGYSGGGAGHDYYPGGGGGSYVNTAMAKMILKTQNGNTTNTSDGYVQYMLTDDGAFYKTVSLEANQAKCMDMKQSNTANGTNIQLWDCNGTGAQEFIFDGLEIKLASNNNKCVDIKDASTTNGKNIQLWDCSGKFNQQWVYDGLTKNIRTAMNWNKCLDLVNAVTTNGNNIQIWDCKDISAQRWILDEATLADTTADNTRIHFALDESKCVDIQAAGTANGTNVQIYHCHDANSQFWIFDGLQIKMKSSPDKCLDLSNSNTNNGSNVQLYDCNGTFAQKWIYDGINKSIHSGIDAHKCLDLLNGNTADHTNIQIWDCQPGNTNQQFVIGE